MAAHMKQVKKYRHHEQADLCVTRAKYRQGRKLTAVKVYTINQESKYLLVQGVPAVGAKVELENMCGEYGAIDEVNVLDDYPSAEYTEAYCVKYKDIQSARFAKKKLDDRSFFGGTLHVCYAPEFETVADTREKLDERRRIIAAKTKNPGTYINREKWKRKVSHTSASSTEPNSQTELITETVSPPQEPTSYIWAGKTYTVEVTKTTESAEKKTESLSTTQTQIPFIPRQLKRQTVKANTNDDLIENTTDSIREKLKRVSEPQLTVSIKRRKKK